jgi:hypothetical protein
MITGEIRANFIPRWYARPVFYTVVLANKIGLLSVDTAASITAACFKIEVAK